MVRALDEAEADEEKDEAVGADGLRAFKGFSGNFVYSIERGAPVALWLASTLLRRGPHAFLVESVAASALLARGLLREAAHLDASAGEAGHLGFRIVVVVGKVGLVE